VTKLPRRIFSFSDTQAKLAAHALGITGIFLSFMDYLPEGERLNFIRHVEDITECPVEFYSDGPRHDDMHDISITEMGDAA
jgi:adenylosuccinate synthase